VLTLIPPLLVIASIIMLVRGVIVWRSGGTPGAVLPGLLLLLVIIGGPHVPWGHVLPLVFLVSIVGATVAQVLKALDRVSTLPPHGLAWAYGDWMIVCLAAPGYSKFAGAIWSVGVATWAISAAVNFVARPALDARRRAADAEIARMQAAQRSAYEGEV
jgi:hypothetical protein